MQHRSSDSLAQRGPDSLLNAISAKLEPEQLSRQGLQTKIKSLCETMATADAEKKVK